MTRIKSLPEWRPITSAKDSGGFVVEATAALSILLYLVFLWLTSRWNRKSTADGVVYSALTGICVGQERVQHSVLNGVRYFARLVSAN